MTTPVRRRNDSPRDGAEEPFRVLIVEDDENFRIWLASIARRLALEVVTANDGIEALQELHAGHFDMLISDYDMPRKDGLELITDVRADEEINDLYSVMLTAYDALSVRVTALTLGYDDFLAKGCSEVEVVAKVAAARRILARQRSLDADAREWREIANQDELTRVATRRFFFEQAERQVVARHEVGVVLFDIDDFKAINDRHGHLTGDRVLRDIGALFLRRTRAGDVIARYGGDEFVLLVLNLTVAEIAVVAERLVAELSDLSVQAGDETLHLSVSIGIGCSALLPGGSVEQLLDAADRELYAKKWLKKHPAATASDVYEYPARNASIVPVRQDPPPAAPPAREKQH